MKTKTVQFNDRTLEVLEETDLSIFRTITDPKEIKSFIEWGVAHHKVKGDIKPIYHPLSQDVLIRAKKEENPFTQLCVWPACFIGGKGLAEEFEKDMEKQCGARVKFAEEVVTLPDVDMKTGKVIPGTGGRQDLFFYVHSEDIGKFAIKRLNLGIRWWEDVLDNGGGVIYSDDILAKYPR